MCVGDHHMSIMATVYVSIGSNIDPEKNLIEAAKFLRQKFPDVRFSSVYETSPRDEANQPDFLNAVATFTTDLEPLSLLKELQSIEQTLKKDPPYRRGPRTIDLDILLYDDQILGTPELTIPHPKMHERRFVLEPLAELDSSEKRWKDLLQNTVDQECTKTEISL